MKKRKIMLCAIAGMLLLTSCIRVVRPGEVGVKRKLGKLKEKIYPQGAYLLNPFLTRIIKVPTRVINIETTLESLPSKEGLSITTQLSILFHIVPDSAISIVSTVGVENGKTIIINVLRSAAADVTSSYYAKDMHSGGKREEIEKAIAEKMTHYLGRRGFVVDAVLLKSLKLPEGLTRAIEEKLKAEQEAQRMEFILNKEKSEAERKRIEAEGIKQYNHIINESLNENLLKYKSIEAFRELANSPNTKTIITNGGTPFLINQE
ncbi:MAG: prohibitin family protein [Cytophagaceae bacterium]|nr:prohibitin family protein [Cytophagaceae bacterium]MDW8457134.1 prohibitin family protein [Cytophagaceae bacterium]